MGGKNEHAKRLAADWSQVFPPLPKENKSPPTKAHAASATNRSNKQKSAEMPSTPTFSPETDLPKLKGLSLRQPWAELVIRGEKTIEYRQRPVHHRGTVYIYASLGRYPEEDEEEFEAEVGFPIADLPRGVVVGTVEIVDCTDEGYGDFAWHLANPKRLEQPIPPLERPQPIWFHPFGHP